MFTLKFYQINKTVITKVISIVMLGLITILFNSCAIFTKIHPYSYLETQDMQKIIVSQEEPVKQFFCSPLGFLPCSLNSQSKITNEENTYIQCAKNILPFAQNIEANYIHIQEPIQILGISWRDAKANLYKCQWLPQPQEK